MKTAAPKPNPEPAPISSSRVVHETPWRCWPAAGGCGHTFGLSFSGGPCPHCGEYAVTRVTFREPEPERGGGAT